MSSFGVEFHHVEERDYGGCALVSKEGEVPPGAGPGLLLFAAALLAASRLRRRGGVRGHRRVLK